MVPAVLQIKQNSVPPPSHFRGHFLALSIQGLGKGHRAVGEAPAGPGLLTSSPTLLPHPMAWTAGPWLDLPVGSVFEAPDVLSLLALPSKISGAQQVSFTWLYRLRGLFQF